MKAKYLLTLAAAVTSIFVFACEEETPPLPSQADWTNIGWQRWSEGDYDGAETAFGNALKVDPYYSEAYGGVAWTYIRQHKSEDALTVLEDAILMSEADAVSVRQIIFMAAATAYEAVDEYETSAEKGRYMADNLLTDDFDFKADHSVTNFDLFLLLSLDYFATGDSANCVWAINKMRLLVGEQGNYQFQDWQKVTEEIERLVEKDPSP
jgi:tetratricopeptide (TPR) repeat protein